MADISLAFSGFQRPGTRVVETDAGYRIAEIASHRTVYLVGSSAAGPVNEPTQVTSLEDFTNQFGASPSDKSVRLFFRNNPEGILYFVRVGVAPTFTVTIGSAVTGNYTLSINSTAVTFARTTQNLGDLESALIGAIQASGVGTAVQIVNDATAGVFRIRSKNPANPLTVDDVEGDMSVVESTPTAPTAQDYVYTIENSFDRDDEYPQGFMIAPEAFQTFTVSNDRLAVANAMDMLVTSEGFDWVAIVDCAPDITTPNTNTVQQDATKYSSPRGHVWYYAPYLTDLEGQTVPPSAAVAGVATLRYQQEGFQQPPAGAKYPIKGVLDVAVRFNNQHQSVLNPLGINLIRNLRNKGVVIWAFRTRSADPMYRFGHTRVIMNVLNGTLLKAFDFFVATAVDGRGVLLHRIEETASSVCRRFWRGKALFGATEQDAFEVVANFSNNTPDELEAGNVLVEVYVAPVPGVEKVLVNTVRVGIGQIQAAASAGRVNNV